MLGQTSEACAPRVILNQCSYVSIRSPSPRPASRDACRGSGGRFLLSRTTCVMRAAKLSALFRYPVFRDRILGGNRVCRRGKRLIQNGPWRVNTGRVFLFEVLARRVSPRSDDGFSAEIRPGADMESRATVRGRAGDPAALDRVKAPGRRPRRIPRSRNYSGSADGPVVCTPSGSRPWRRAAHAIHDRALFFSAGTARRRDPSRDPRPAPARPAPPRPPRPHPAAQSNLRGR
jgi:hypothetical protein